MGSLVAVAGFMEARRVGLGFERLGFRMNGNILGVRSGLSVGRRFFVYFVVGLVGFRRWVLSRFIVIWFSGGLRFSLVGFCICRILGIWDRNFVRDSV